MATISGIEDFRTQFEMFAFIRYYLPYVPTIILEISEQILIFACTQRWWLPSLHQSNYTNILKGLSKSQNRWNRIIEEGQLWGTE